VSVIQVNDVWKRFRIPHERRPNVLDHLVGVVSGGWHYDYEEFWALKDVSFSIEKGQSLGIVGPNGSGKSTLLKLMARVMKPDRGSIQTLGSVVPVLELGIGFHPDLTVKENALVYGIVMGLRRRDMRRKMADILEFADLTRFQDAKLKNLSTGMQVRLAFSIAIETKADIFLVDEALSVGDIAFQAKCLDKFREFKKEGKSIILVSHSMDLVNRFCEMTVYLSSGEVRSFAASETVIKQYEADMSAAH